MFQITNQLSSNYSQILTFIQTPRRFQTPFSLDKFKLPIQTLFSLYIYDLCSLIIYLIITLHYYILLLHLMSFVGLVDLLLLINILVSH